MRKKEGDKERDILDAATQTFSTEGFAGSKVAVIAEQAGIGTGSVYLYFSDKDAILDGIFLRFWAKALAAMSEVAPSDPATQLQEQLAAFFDLLMEDRALATVYLREHHRFIARHATSGNTDFHACVKMGESIFHKGVSAGVFDKTLEVPLARDILFSAMRAAMDYLVAHPNAHTKRVRNQALKMCLAMLRGS